MHTKTASLIVTSLFLLGLLLPACTQAASNCQQPKVFCVGLVTENGGRVDDRGFDQAVWAGIQQAKADGLVGWAASIETVDARDYGENIKVFADAGYDLIVTVGRDMSTATQSAAMTYPDTYFIGVDQDQTGSQVFNPNLTGLIFPEDQMGFLAGALAALLTQTGQVGAVCGSDTLPAMQRYGDGFQAGVAYINSDVHAAVEYHNQVEADKSLADPSWGAATANALIDGGVDIVFGAGGTTGSNALVAAAMRGAHGIGVETDEYYALPVAAPRLYASVVKLVAPDLEALIKLAVQAQAKTAGYPTGDYIGRIGLSPFHDQSSAVSDIVKNRISAINQGLLAGEIKTGVVISNP